MLSLIAALDTMDGDTDREPSLAGFDGVSVPTDDREGGDVLDEGEPNDWDGEDSDADEDNGDKEPSLGGLAVMLRNGKLIVDGEGDNADLEYSLDWGFHVGSQAPERGVSIVDPIVGWLTFDIGKELDVAPVVLNGGIHLLLQQTSADACPKCLPPSSRG